jgi:hypothetical protein
MAIIEDSNDPSNLLRIEDNGAARVTINQRGDRYRHDAITGIMPAALAANNICFAMRLNPAANVEAYIDSIILTWYVQVGFTVPNTWGRRLAPWRQAATAAYTGGVALPAPMRKLSASPVSQFDPSVGGQGLISTTAALGNTGTYETTPAGVLHLAKAGNLADLVTQRFDFGHDDGGPPVILPGEGLTVRWPQVMDAAGTWSLGVAVDWREVVPLA